MSLQKPIVTVTLNPSADIFVEVDEWRPSEKLRASVMRWEPGGGGLNVSRVLRALGHDSLAIHTAGGPEGARLNSALDRLGIHHRAIDIRDPTRISILVAERKSRARYTLTFPGPTMTPSECAACLAAIAASGAARGTVVCSGSLPPGTPQDFYATVAKMAASSGGRTIVDTSGSALAATLRTPLYLAKVNGNELSDLAGRNLATREDIAAFARHLLSAGSPNFLAVTLGAEGAMLFTPDAELFATAPQIDVRSPVGAGDSFLAALVAGLVDELTPQAALQRAVHVGAAAAAGGGIGHFAPELGWARDPPTERETASVSPTGN
jgi:6-phosphofructokinase 2